jgi:hypothetical protein
MVLMPSTQTEGLPLVQQPPQFRGPQSCVVLHSSERGSHVEPWAAQSAHRCPPEPQAQSSFPARHVPSASQHRSQFEGPHCAVVVQVSVNASQTWPYCVQFLQTLPPVPHAQASPPRVQFPRASQHPGQLHGPHSLESIQNKPFGSQVVPDAVQSMHALPALPQAWLSPPHWQAPRASQQPSQFQSPHSAGLTHIIAWGSHVAPDSVQSVQARPAAPQAELSPPQLHLPDGSQQPLQFHEPQSPPSGRHVLLAASQ